MCAACRFVGRERPDDIEPPPALQEVTLYDAAPDIPTMVLFSIVVVMMAVLIGWLASYETREGSPHPAWFFVMFGVPIIVGVGIIFFTYR